MIQSTRTCCGKHPVLITATRRGELPVYSLRCESCGKLAGGVDSEREAVVAWDDSRLDISSGSSSAETSRSWTPDTARAAVHDRIKKQYPGSSEASLRPHIEMIMELLRELDGQVRWK